MYVLFSFITHINITGIIMAVTESSLKKLYSELTKIIEEESPKKESIEKGKILDLSLMQTILEKTLSSHATVILPKTLEVATHRRQLLLYLESVNKTVQADIKQFGHIVKPLVLIMPQLKPSPGFITWVALPRNYQVPCGKPTGNVNEVLFCMDPRVSLENRAMPAEFLQFFRILQAGCSFNDTIEIRRVEIAPTFPKVMFCNGSQKQQAESADNSYWAVYNAMMIVLTGHIEFAKEFKAPVPNIAARFESWIQQLLSERAIESRSIEVPIGPILAGSPPGGPDLPSSESLEASKKPKIQKQESDIVIRKLAQDLKITEINKEIEKKQVTEERKQVTEESKQEREKEPQISKRDRDIIITLQKLEEIKSRDLKDKTNFHSRILNNLIVSYKYLILHHNRNINHKLPRNRNFEILQTLFNKDKLVKISIYHQKIEDLRPFFKMLDPGPMAILLKHLDEPSTLIKQLEHSRQVQYQKLKEWETALHQELTASETWRAYLKRKGKTAANFIYERSLMRLGADLLHWMATPMAAELCNSETALGLKNRTKQAVKSGAEYFNLSASNLARVEHSMEYLLSQQQIPRMIRTVGFGVGLYYSYTTGIYPLIRMLATSTLALKVIEYVQKIEVNDAAATVKLPNLNYRTNTRILHIVSLFTALLEAQYAGNYDAFVLAVGGVVSTEAGTRMAIQYWPELQIAPGSRPSENQVYTLLLLSVALQDLGYLVTGFGSNIYNTIRIKERDQEYVASILRSFIVKENQEFLDITMPSVRWNPLQWFNEENAINVSWRNGNTGLFFRSRCQIPFSRYQIPLHADCTTPQQYYPLGKSTMSQASRL